MVAPNPEITLLAKLRPPLLEITDQELTVTPVLPEDARGNDAVACKTIELVGVTGP